MTTPTFIGSVLNMLSHPLIFQLAYVTVSSERLLLTAYSAIMFVHLFCLSLPLHCQVKTIKCKVIADM